jgi:hypothetical protein
MTFSVGTPRAARRSARRIESSADENDGRSQTGRSPIRLNAGRKRRGGSSAYAA